MISGLIVLKINQITDFEINSFITCGKNLTSRFKDLASQHNYLTIGRKTLPMST